MKKILLSIVVATATLLGNDLATIMSTKTVKIGVRISQPPFSKQVGDHFEGFEVDLAKRIGKDLVGDDGKVILIGVDAKDRIPMLEKNEADIMIANFSISPDRAKHVDFSVPYFSNNLAALTAKNKNITTLNQLIGKKILSIPATTTEEYFKGKSDFTLVPCQNGGECFEMLRKGEGDAYVHTNIACAAFPLVDPNYEMSIKTIGDITYIAAGVAKGNADLLKFVNKEILLLSSEGFFKKAFNESFVPFYKGALDKKYFLLDDLYVMMFGDQDQH